MYSKHCTEKERKVRNNKWKVRIVSFYSLLLYLLHYYKCSEFCLHGYFKSLKIILLYLQI